MTLFEYVSVVTSIVLSLSAAQLLSRLRVILQPPGQYWMFTLWVGFALMLHLLIWWEFWGYRDFQGWNFASFAMFLFNPAVLYICSSAMAGSDVPERWSMRFDDTRRTMFLCFGLLTVGSVLRRLLLVDMPILSENNLPELLFALLFVAGYLLRSAKLQTVVVIASWTLLLVTTTTDWFQAGAVVSAP